LKALLPRDTPERNAKVTAIISILNTKGGVGRTTCAVGLAGAFTRLRPTLLVDADPRGGVENVLRCAGPGPHLENVQVLSAGLFEALVPRLDYEFVVVDSQQGVGHDPARDAVIRNSDLVIVPVSPAPLDLEGGLRTLTEVLEPAGIPARAVMISTARERSGALEAARARLEAHGTPVFKTGIAHLAAIQHGHWGDVLGRKPNSEAMRAVLNFSEFAVEVLCDMQARFNRKQRHPRADTPGARAASGSR